MRSGITRVAAAAVLASTTIAGSTSAVSIVSNNVLTNGQLDNTVSNTVPAGGTFNAAGLPTSWNAFGAGGIVVHSVDQGTSSRNSVIRGEPGSSNTGTQGDAVRFGGGTVSNADHGIYQTFTTVPGRLYYFIGTLNATNTISTGNLNSLAVGLVQGGGNQNNTPTRAQEVSVGSPRTNLGITVTGTGLGSRNLGRRAFWNSNVATGTSMTARVGIRGSGGIAGGGTNVAVDGLRVVEYDMTPNASLVNVGFETNNTTLANWGVDAGTEGTPRDFSNWVPLGGNVTDTGGIFTATGDGGGTAALLDQFNGSGRQMLIQRVDGGGVGSLYTLSGRVNPFNRATDADARIGIDPTGGMDPSSTNIVWSAAAVANGTWQTLSIPVQANLSGDGVTVFLAAGYDGPASRGASGGAAFDNISLTIVPLPEPTSFGVVLGGLGLMGLRRTRRRSA